jgi:hypothetical protein
MSTDRRWVAEVLATRRRPTEPAENPDKRKTVEAPGVESLTAENGN